MNNDCPRNIETSASQLFFQNKDSLEYKALLLVSKLPHPQRPILASFVQNTADREVAAQFLLDNEASGQDVYEILANWVALAENIRPTIAADLSEEQRSALIQRHGGACCFSRNETSGRTTDDLVAAMIVSPSLFERLHENPRLLSMLNAFLGKDKVRNLRLVLDTESSSSTTNLQQMLLLSSDAFLHFRSGHLSLKAFNLGEPGRYLPVSNSFPLPNRISTNIVSLADISGGLIASPSPVLLDIHHRFSKTLAWIEVAEHMKAHPLKGARGGNGLLNFEVSHILLPLLRSIWIRFPAVIRSYLYDKLMTIGHRLYGPTLSQRMHRLPFGLYLRVAQADWHPRHQAELEALRLVGKYTSIPVPKAIDICQNGKKSYLLMTRIPGQPIGRLLNRMSDEQLQKATDQLRGYIAELRSIPNQWVSSEGISICSASGNGILDWRIGDSENHEWKFATVAEFHESLTAGYSEKFREKARNTHAKNYEVVFTHADLNPRNILADEAGKITGIVDWECAAWMPEYWEYTKMHFAVRSTIRWLADVVDQLFDVYREELRVENMLTDNGAFF